MLFFILIYGKLFSLLKGSGLGSKQGRQWLSGLLQGTDVLAHLAIYKYALVAELEN